MKKFFSLMLALGLVFTVGCGEEKKTEKKTETKTEAKKEEKKS